MSPGCPASFFDRLRYFVICDGFFWRHLNFPSILQLRLVSNTTYDKGTHLGEERSLEMGTPVLLLSSSPYEHGSLMIMSLLTWRDTLQDLACIFRVGEKDGLARVSLVNLSWREKVVEIPQVAHGGRKLCTAHSHHAPSRLRYGWIEKLWWKRRGNCPRGTATWASLGGRGPAMIWMPGSLWDLSLRSALFQFLQYRSFCASQSLPRQQNQLTLIETLLPVHLKWSNGKCTVCQSTTWHDILTHLYRQVDMSYVSIAALHNAGLEIWPSSGRHEGNTI